MSNKKLIIEILSRMDENLINLRKNDNITAEALGITEEMHNKIFDELTKKDLIIKLPKSDNRYSLMLLRQLVLTVKGIKYLEKHKRKLSN